MEITGNIAAQIRSETVQLNAMELTVYPLLVRLVTGAGTLTIMMYLGMLYSAAFVLVVAVLAESLLWYLHRHHVARLGTAPLWKTLLLWLLGCVIGSIYLIPGINFSRHPDAAVVMLSIIWVCSCFMYAANTYSKLPLFAFSVLVPVVITGFIVIAMINVHTFDSSGPRDWPLMVLGVCLFGALVAENVIRQKRSNNALDSALAVTQQQFEELQNVKQQLLDAVEGLDSGFALYDQDERLVMHNSRFVAMHPGLSDLIHPGVRYDTLMTAMLERRFLLAPEKAAPLLEQGSQVDTLDITLANGALYNIRFNTTAHGDRVSLITDITDAVQGQQKLRAMFDVSADAMFDCDLIHGTITFDTGFKTQFGHDWIGEHTLPSVWNTALHPDDAQRVHQALDRFIHSQQVRLDIEFRMERADGSWAYVAQRTVALRDDNGKAVSMIGAVADLTEKHQLEDQLRVAQKMEAMGRISGGIAHDFNNLLAVIMGNAEYLQLLAGDKEIHDCVDEIVSASKRGAELTRRLLSFARRSRLAPQRIAPHEMIAGMQPLFARVLPAPIKLNIPLDETTWPIRVDPAFLESSLLNLVINARDAMPEGGTLTIETTNQLITDDYTLPRKETLAPGRYVMMAVSDTGHGIPKDIIERVIEPFFTTKGPTQGSGMGLSMVDGFARQSGGLMHIYSEPGVGTSIRFLLPADTGAHDPPAELVVPASTQRIDTRLRVLLVEDDAKVRDVVARILQDVGLEILQAESGDAALTLYESLPRPPDVLLTDVVMPGHLQGPTLACQLRQQQPGLQIIFMSGYASEAAINGNGLCADDHFLMKPIQRGDLLGLMAQLTPLGAATEKGASTDEQE